MILAAADTRAPNWLERVLSYSADNAWYVTAGRTVAVVIAVWLIYFAFSRRWAVGWDRRLIYGLVGLLTLLQEGEQLAAGADFLVWRLPTIIVLQVACLSAVRRYSAGVYGQHEHERDRERVASST